MENGSFTLWDPSQIIGNYSDKVDEIDNQKSLLYAEEADEEESFPIMCAEWNSLKNNFLAFGSTNVLLIDAGKNVSYP